MWTALTADEARDLAGLLLLHAGLAERGTGFEEVPNSPSAAGPSQV